jgi:hypothetical protein
VSVTGRASQLSSRKPTGELTKTLEMGALRAYFLSPTGFAEHPQNMSIDSRSANQRVFIFLGKNGALGRQQS